MNKPLLGLTLAGALLAYGCGDSDRDAFNDVVLPPTTTATTTSGTSTSTTRTTTGTTTGTSTGTGTTTGTTTTTSTSPTPAVVDVIGLQAANTLVQFRSNAPQTPLRTITGLTFEEEDGTPILTADTLVAIDFRPQNGGLYALGRDAGNTQLSLYHLSLDTFTGTTGTGTARRIGLAFTPATAFTAATRFDIDFNPTVDRVRVVGSNGLDLRLNPNNGAVAATDTNIANGTGGTGTPAVSGAAYTNSEQNAGGTTQTSATATPVANSAGVTSLYTLDATSNTLNIQSPPNNGTQTGFLPVGVDFDAVDGFDIPRGVNVTAGNAAASGFGYAALRVGAASQFYTVDLTTGVATTTGTTTVPLVSAALAPSVTSLPLVAASVDTTTPAAPISSLVRFYSDTSATPITVPITFPTGTAAGLQLTGIAYRPATGVLYGYTFDYSTGNRGTYRIDPQTAVATAVGTPGANASVGIALSAATNGFGIDFEPSTDQIKGVIGVQVNDPANSFNNFTLDPATDNGTTYGPVTGAAVSPFPAQNGASAIAYTNGYDATTTQALFAINDVSDVLNSLDPNSGVLTPIATLSTGVAVANGFFIPRTVTTSNAGGTIPATSVSNLGYVVSGTSLYSLNLQTGAMTAIRTLPTTLSGLAGL